MSIRTSSVLSLCCTLLFSSPAAAISCPTGTELLVQERPRGKEERCILNRNGKRHGPFRTWYSNGHLREEGSYRFGKPQGLWIYYYPNGQKRMEGSWRLGKTQGPWTYWYEDGMRESAGQFAGGKRQGKWTYWAADGTVRFVGRWNDGKLDGDAVHASARQHE